jgi:hypothetical protein
MSIEMDPTPATIVAVDDMNIQCTPEETQTRLATCQSCENFSADPDTFITSCTGCGCHISFMTTLNFKSCPKGNW